MHLSRFYAIPIIGLALLLTLPAILAPQFTHDSFWINWVWADQFTAELAKGNLYPRWLPQSHGGLGSPVFYYYPPLAFHVTGLFGLLGMSTYASIIAAFFAGLVGSGLAMHAWLRQHAPRPLLGAAIYMVAPYHIIDFYIRGALAEFTAIALIPALALGLRRAVEGRYILGALAYGAMILTHLPLALLASLFFVGPYTIYLARTHRRVISRLIIPLAVGLALSAVYLLPAFALERYRDVRVLWSTEAMQPESWSAVRWLAEGAPSGLRLMFTSVILVLTPPIVLLLATKQKRWGAYAAACCGLSAGLIPGFWTLPLLESVQFPFRMLPLAEFAIATGAASLAWNRPWLVLLATPAIALSIVFVTFQNVPVKISLEEMLERPDVPENLPPGDRPFSWPSEWALQVAARYREPKRVRGLYN